MPKTTAGRCLWLGSIIGLIALAGPSMIHLVYRVATPLSTREAQTERYNHLANAEAFDESLSEVQRMKMQDERLKLSYWFHARGWNIDEGDEDRSWFQPWHELMHYWSSDQGTTSHTSTSSYSTKPNTSGYPFPTAFAAVLKGKALHFDWKRYIDEGISEGERVFRAHLAFSNGFTSQNTEIMGIRESASDEMTRYRIAADEVSNGCVLIEAMYRDRLKNDAGLQSTLEEFITHHRKAIEASIKLVGGSWDGGSGARVAYPAARLDAFVRYRAALLDLRASLHFQDFPEIAFPTPSEVGK